MTEQEKMAAGLLYTPSDPTLSAACQRAKQLCFEINHLPPRELARREELLRELLPTLGKDGYVEPPLYVDYGSNIQIGNHFYSNHNLTILDCA